ncbi:MAG: hypothetical protein ACJA2G_000870, partial [Cognaticolwellia sp.]
DQLKAFDKISSTTIGQKGFIIIVHCCFINLTN